jgi:hypothetical protein
VRAGLDLGVVPDAERAGEHGLRINLGALRHPHAGRYLEAVNFGGDPPGKHIGLGLQVALMGSDVLPVPVAYIAE